MTYRNSKKFDLVVLGNEPAALWILDQLQMRVPKIRLGWIEYSRSWRMPTVVDSKISERFGIPMKERWAIDFSTPSDTLTWTEGLTQRRYPSASTDCPEALPYCQGLWRRFGRTKELSPSALAKLIGRTEFSHWNPKPDVYTVCVEGRGQIKDVQSLERGEIELTFSESIWDTQSLVLALSPAEIQILGADLPRLLDWVQSPSLLSATYRTGVVPWTIRFKEDFVPKGLPPVVILFENTVMPDPDSEILVVDVDDRNREIELTLWLNVIYPFTEAELRTTAERAFRILSDRMPFAQDGILFSTPDFRSVSHLNEESLRRFIPDYPMSRLHDFHTRHKRVSWISPDHHCHLVYPEGPLELASKLVGKIVSHADRRPLKPETSTQPTP